MCKKVHTNLTQTRTDVSVDEKNKNKVMSIDRPYLFEDVSGNNRLFMLYILICGSSDVFNGLV